MGRIRNTLRKLENKENSAVLIEQQDGTVARFRQSDLAHAYANLHDRMREVGTDAMPEEHPLLAAVRNSPDPHWRQSLYAEEVPDEPIEDLSEK